MGRCGGNNTFALSIRRAGDAVFARCWSALRRNYLLIGWQFFPPPLRPGSGDGNRDARPGWLVGFDSTALEDGLALFGEGGGGFLVVFGFAELGEIAAFVVEAFCECAVEGSVEVVLDHALRKARA